MHGHKAGSKVGSAPWQFPADGLASPGECPPVGIAVARMPCGAWGVKGRGGPLAGMKKQGAGVPASCFFGFRVRLWVG